MSRYNWKRIALLALEAVDIALLYVGANRQRIVQSRRCFFRHRITAVNVWGNRQQPRG
jgi:hypothetical protein